MIFKYLSQEFDNNVYYLVKQNYFYLYEQMNNFKKFKEQLPNFYSPFTSKKIVAKSICS